MTEIQQTNIAVANFIIDELYKEKPFDLILTPQQYSSFLNIVENSPTTGLSYRSWQEGECFLVGVDKSNVNQIYHKLSSYIAKHEHSRNTIDSFINDGGFNQAFKDVFGLPDSVKQSLKEVS
ncbi:MULTISPECIES: hypothetical protein [Acinetobacter]|jgi:subtilase family serine protease|uniref:hypothetical protein n=1 Tax=Acinetobacter TaxID=469 RepID=UPI0021CDDFA9|nr:MULTISPECIES: hypothetical protein [Acinetobacter]MCU4606997.1 hypothetical protein [Acinetobacter radioresistens]MCX0348394.1 hypothetical protein [Acinetobacter radioresistens]